MGRVILGAAHHLQPKKAKRVGSRHWRGWGGDCGLQRGRPSGPGYPIVDPRCEERCDRRDRFVSIPRTPRAYTVINRVKCMAGWHAAQQSTGDEGHAIGTTLEVGRSETGEMPPSRAGRAGTMNSRVFKPLWEGLFEPSGRARRQVLVVTINGELVLASGPEMV
ncbi:hypothetical protein VTG60DRAFT_1053 [Thermothelomyces hinnuleus]